MDTAGPLVKTDGGAGHSRRRHSRRAEGGAWLDSQVSPSFLFFWGLVLAPALVLQHELWLKGLQALLLVALALGTGRVRSRGILLGSLIFVASTVAVNLLSPLGRLIVRVGPLRVTEGALRSGLAKALTLVSLTYLSRLCVREGLTLPGRAGRYLRLTFRYLNALLAKKGAVFAGQDLVGRIDGLLAAVWRQEEQALPESGRAGRTTPAGMGLAAAMAGLLWFPALWRF